MAIINKLKTRYLVIKLEIAEENGGTFSDGTTTKFIYAFSGTTNVAGSAYQKVDCVIQTGVGFQQSTSTMIIYGMSESDINTFTRTNLLDPVFAYSKNTVSVYAGYSLNSDGLPPFIYKGNVLRAGADYNISRDRPFIITSLFLFTDQNLNLDSFNVNGVISIDNVLRNICNKARIIYKGSNITGNDYNPIFTGSIKNQLTQAAKKYNLQFYIINSEDQVQTTAYFAPQNTALIESDFILQASDDGGMIGFPIIEDMGFTVRSYFNPAIYVGQSIEVNSITVPYINNRKLYINQMIHELHNREAPWQSTLQLNPYLAFPTGTV